MKNIALTGGGTAGHITPNLALIPELKKRNYNIIYIGSKNGMEKDIMSRHNIPFFGISADKLRRYHDIKNFAMPFNVIRGITEAKKILKEQKIDVLFSKGGYVAVPVVIAAHSLHIPIISHEADYTLGLANTIASPFSNIICCNFSETAQKLKKKGIWTGCPIRPVLLNGNKNKGLDFLHFNNNKPIIFVTGGSLGSKFINDMISKHLDTLLQNFNIVHSCGKDKLNELYTKKEPDGSYTQLKDGYVQYELITDKLPDIFAASDFVISRAGANVIFEILALKKPNLLIPLSKRASRGDQILNANSFQNKNYSIVMFEEDYEKDKNIFFEKLKKLKDNKNNFINTMEKTEIQNAVIKICDIIDNQIK